MTMIRTTEGDRIVDQVTSQDIVDDFELGKDEVVDVKDKKLHKQKLRRRVDQYKGLYEKSTFLLMIRLGQLSTLLLTGIILCGKGVHRNQHQPQVYIGSTIPECYFCDRFYFDNEVGASQRLFQELSSKPEKDTTSARQYDVVKKLGKEPLGELNNYVLESPHRPLSFYAKPRSHHWKLQTDGVISPVLNAPRSSSEGNIRSHALHVLMPVLLELSGIVLSCWWRRVMINLSL